MGSGAPKLMGIQGRHPLRDGIRRSVDGIRRSKGRWESSDAIFRFLDEKAKAGDIMSRPVAAPSGDHKLRSILSVMRSLGILSGLNLPSRKDRMGVGHRRSASEVPWSA